MLASCPSALFLISAICLPLISFCLLFPVWFGTVLCRKRECMCLCICYEILLWSLRGVSVPFVVLILFSECSHVSPPDPSSRPMLPVSASTPSKLLELPNRFTFRFYASESSCALSSLRLVHSIGAMTDLIPQMRVLPGHPQKAILERIIYQSVRLDAWVRSR